MQKIKFLTWSTQERNLFNMFRYQSPLIVTFNPSSAKKQGLIICFTDIDLHTIQWWKGNVMVKYASAEDSQPCNDTCFHYLHRVSLLKILSISMSSSSIMPWSLQQNSNLSDLLAGIPESVVTYTDMHI